MIYDDDKHINSTKILIYLVNFSSGQISSEWGPRSLIENMVAGEMQGNLEKVPPTWLCHHGVEFIPFNLV